MAILSRRTEAQSEKRAAVEAAVLEGTERLLASGRSYAELKIEEIATAAGISRTAFYFYFHDKRELLMRLTEEVSETLYAEAEAWWSGDGDGRAELEGALRRVIDLYERHGVLLRAVVEASAYDESVAGFWRALVTRFAQASRRRIEAEQAAGEIRELPAEATSFALSWMTERACYQRIVQGAGLADEEFTQALVQVWVATLYGP